MDSVTKICTICKINKPLNEFFYKKDSRDRLSYKCRKCSVILNKKWRHENKEKVRECRRKWRKNNKEKMLEYGRRKRKKEGKDKRRLINKLYREKNIEKILERERLYYKNNKEKRLEYGRKWRKNNKEKYAIICKKSTKRNVENLSDQYIKRKITQFTHLKSSDIPKELIELKRAHMKFKRAIKEKFK